MTFAEISEADHAKLVSLLDERRRLVRQRKRAKYVASRQALTLAQKVEKDRKFADRLAEVNEQIDKLINCTQGGA